MLCVKPDFVPEHIISTLLTNRSIEYSNASVGWKDGQEVTNYRKTKWLTLPQGISNELYNTMFLIHEQVLQPIYNSKLVSVEPPQFLRYDVGDEYKVHNDSEEQIDGKLQQVVKRDISLLLYLNDDYEGGEIEFTKLQVLMKPKAGMLIAFPSYMEYEHKVHPVTKGTRYAIVSWIATEKRLYARPYDRD
jgi:predicted 2-oxoglutarate/Fe(II)-dependent dioxygenase YbiX